MDFWIKHINESSEGAEAGAGDASTPKKEKRGSGFFKRKSKDLDEKKEKPKKWSDKINNMQSRC